MIIPTSEIAGLRKVFWAEKWCNKISVLKQWCWQPLGSVEGARETLGSKKRVGNGDSHSPQTCSGLVPTRPKEWVAISIPFPRGEDGSTEGQEQPSVKGRGTPRPALFSPLSSTRRFCGRNLDVRACRTEIRQHKCEWERRLSSESCPVNSNFLHGTVFAAHKAFVYLPSRLWRNSRQNRAAGVRGLR